MARKIRLQLPKDIDVELVFVDPPPGASGAQGAGGPQADPQVMQPVTEIQSEVLGWNGCGCGGGNCVC